MTDSPMARPALVARRAPGSHRAVQAKAPSRINQLAVRAFTNSRVLMAADQGVSSLSNLMLTVVVARSVGVRDFAMFSLVYAVYSFLLGAQRAFLSEPLILRYHTPERGRLDREHCVALAFLGALAIGAVTAAVAVCTHNGLLLAAAVAVPIALIQDAIRYCCIADERFGRALTSDSIWLLVLIAGLVATPHVTISPANTWLLVWGIGALIACGFVRVRPSFRGCWTWLKAVRGNATKILAEHLLSSGLTQLVLLTVPLVATLATVASIKAGQTAGASVLSVFNMALALASLPAMTRSYQSGGVLAACRVATKVVLATTAIGVGWAAMTLFLPAHVGALAFGASWHGASGAAPVYALQATAVGAWIEATYLLRATGNSGSSVVLRVVFSPVLFAATIGGVAWFGVAGAAWGLFLSTVLAAGAWWLVVARLVRSERTEPGILHVPDSDWSTPALHRGGDGWLR